MSIIIRTARIDENGDYIFGVTEKIGERYKQTGLGIIVNIKKMTIKDWYGNFILRHKLDNKFIDEIEE